MLTTAREAVSRYVEDGSTIFVGGFGSLYPFALAHEIIRLGKKNLTLAKPSPELIGDQLIGAGAISRLIISWEGNPGIGSSYCFRRAIEKKIPHSIVLEEYTHAAITAMLKAGAMGMPFIATRYLMGSDLLGVQQTPRAKVTTSPFTDEPVCVLRALQPDVALVHAQRADEEGNVQGWGILSDIRDGAFASSRVIASVEEIVPSEVSRRDPNRTIIPGFKVDALVVEPWAAHPSACQGYYDRDNSFFLEYEDSTRSLEGFRSYLEKWVYSVKDRAEYAETLGLARLNSLRPRPYLSEPVNYGLYT
jgi:glutaconate CoA-transferase subunit A